MRTIVVGDIHGCIEELKELIIAVKYNKDNDKLIFLGDYIDRGNNSAEVIEYVRELQRQSKNVIALMGNHEEMMLEYFSGLTDRMTWDYNGGDKTRKSYKGNKSQMLSDIKWIKSLPLYYEDDEHIYVHGGINPNLSMKEQSKEVLLWSREKFIDNTAIFQKQVIFGHTPSILITGKKNPYRTIRNNIGIDTGCVFEGGCLTGLTIIDGKVENYIQIER